MTRIKPQGTLRQKVPVIKDPAYMEFMKQLCQVHGCVLCKAPAERAHIRMGEVCEMCGGMAGREVSNSADPSWDGWWMCMLCEATGYRFGKLPTGMSERDDPWTLPVCPNHHRLLDDSQHSMNEREWWALQGIDPLAVCKQLQDAYPDLEKAMAVLERAKES